MTTDDKSQADRLARFLLKRMVKAVREFGMIRDGDRIAVALSGGKDSFSLLEMLKYNQRFSPHSYSLFAIHVIGDARGPKMPPYPDFEDYLSRQGIEYLIRPSHLAENEKLPMSCERCAWNRRRVLFEMARDLGCNKVAFGHHLDDLAQTALLNLMFQGRPETMAPIREYFGGTITVIRPFAYAPEREIVRFAKSRDYPKPPPACPKGEHTQRRRMKELLEEMKKDCPKVKWNLVKAALKSMAGESPNLMPK